MGVDSCTWVCRYNENAERYLIVFCPIPVTTLPILREIRKRIRKLCPLEHVSDLRVLCEVSPSRPFNTEACSNVRDASAMIECITRSSVDYCRINCGCESMIMFKNDAGIMFRMKTSEEARSQCANLKTFVMSVVSDLCLGT